ncbi:MAG: hypothetical protein RL011_761 [Pseudomonadota bacterium]|jgi:heat shock protein HslJ
MTQSTNQLPWTPSRLRLHHIGFCVALAASCSSAQAETSQPDAVISSGTHETVADLVNTDWEQPGHFGSLHIDSHNVSGEDGCNQFSGIDTAGESAGFVFTGNGEVKIGEHWHLVTTLRACWPERLPTIELPSKTWASYQLKGDTLTVKLVDGQAIELVKKH